MASVSTTRIIPSPVSNWKGGRFHHIDSNENRVADEQDPILVKMTEDGWQPVETIENSVDRFTMEQDYGYWQDREVSHREGWPWNRKTVVDRPRDNKIDADELSFPEFKRYRSDLGGYSQLFQLGAEIVKDDQGRLTLDEHFHRFAPRRIIGEGDISRLSDYRGQESNWKVSTS